MEKRLEIEVQTEFKVLDLELESKELSATKEHSIEAPKDRFHP